MLHTKSWFILCVTGLRSYVMMYWPKSTDIMSCLDYFVIFFFSTLLVCGFFVLSSLSSSFLVEIWSVLFASISVGDVSESARTMWEDLTASTDLLSYSDTTRDGLVPLKAWWMQWKSNLGCYSAIGDNSFGTFISEKGRSMLKSSLWFMIFGDGSFGELSLGQWTHIIRFNPGQ